MKGMEIVKVDALIHLVRGHRVMLDSDLAAIYGVTTKRLNEQVRRNASRFPEDFMFRLSAEEHAVLRSQIATSKPGSGGRRYLPLVFTQEGVSGRRSRRSHPGSLRGHPRAAAAAGGTAEEDRLLNRARRRSYVRPI
ncbi:MAG: ORF6N domain-containing protein [Elusimicrobia bacterium]|nr:ORF6N domain-containing protein [Elusimicrobiota bacterium]